MPIKGLTDSFSFSNQFQKDIISSMIQNPELYTRVGTQIEPKYFELKEYNDIFRCIKKYYDEYLSLPGQTVLTELVSRINNSNDVVADIDDIYNIKIKNSDVKQIETDVVNFISYQAMKKSVMNCVDLLNNPDNYTQMKAEIDKALIVGQSMINTGIDAYSDEAIIDRFCNEDKEEKNEIISTGWSQLDEILCGGWSRKTISSVFGVANSGKSNFLINFSANALLQNYNICYVSLEMDEDLILRRLDSRLLGVDQKQLISKDSNVINTKLKELLNQRIGKFFVKQFPANTVTCDDISAFIDRLENVHNLKIDMCVIDYCDILKASQKYNDKRNEIDSIYVEARNIALTHNIVVLTGTQLNRSGLIASKEGKVLDSEYIATDYGIIRTLDTGLFLNTNPQDLKNKTSVLYVGKNRMGEMGQQIRLYTDYSQCLIKPWTENSVVQNSNISSEPLAKQEENKLKSIFEVR